MSELAPTERVASATSPRGEVFLLRRASDGALELRVNGVFVMDTAHTSTERMLATTALDVLRENRGGDDGVRVFLGGLGLGCTLREALDGHGVTSAHVAEIEPAIVEWHRRGLVPGSALRDERVTVSPRDVREVLAELANRSVDLVLLDVDNGPEYLVHEGNAAVYRREFLALCREKLSPGGIVAIWSADVAPELAATLREVFGDCRSIAVPVLPGREALTYHLHFAAAMD